MTSLLFCCLAAGAPAPGGPLVLLAGTPEYAAQRSPEEVHIGTLERAVSPAGQPPGYRLAVLDPAVGTHYRLLHAPGKAHLLEPLVGKPVRITAKAVRPRRDGKAIPLFWIGLLQPLAADQARGDGVLARGFWVPAGAGAGRVRTLVFRDGTALARAMDVSGPGAPATATALLAGRLGAPAIDWQKQMVLCIYAGLSTSSLEVLRARREGKTLVVIYRRRGEARGGFAVASQAALVPRFDGAVEFREAPALPSPLR